MKIFIIVPLDFGFSPLSIAGKQFEEKASLLALSECFTSDKERVWRGYDYE